jgi:two-component system cell cycle response regulator
MLILIAEDEPLSRFLLATAVKQFGHDCLLAEDGAQAWQLFQTHAVDVIISDRMMPVMDGVELCRRVRQAPQGYTYFIFLTGLSEKKQALLGIQAGADDYLIKPFDPHELRMRLIVAARMSVLHQQLAEQQVKLARMNEQLFAQARRDSLTQLGNRLKLREDLDALFSQADLQGQSYCAIMCDVDAFKAYNDHYGHLAGDKVLQTIACTLSQTCRASDLVYRYGGEEFLWLLPESSLASAASAAERLRRAVEALRLEHAGTSPAGIVTLSAGIAMAQMGMSKGIHVWLHEADSALYQAKKLGRNRVVAFEACDLALLH